MDDRWYLSSMAMVAEHLDDEQVGKLIEAVKYLGGTVCDGGHCYWRDRELIRTIITHALDLRVVEALLMYYDDVNCDTPLRYAVYSRKWKRVRLLIQYNADPERISSSDICGYDRRDGVLWKSRWGEFLELPIIMTKSATKSATKSTTDMDAI
jgi:hypothetical protein